MDAGTGDTIVALACPPGGARRGVVRLSGPRALEITRAAWRGAVVPDPDSPRGVYSGSFADGVGELPGLCLWMPGPRSFTREDVVELHLPGSPFLLARALERCLELGARGAEPGEFTRRAFENGRIDLTRAEGVLALVQARGEAERASAAALLFGGLEERLGSLRARLDALRSLCEASLDFDETDTGHVPAAELESQLSELLAEAREAARWESRRVVTGGERRVVLRGAPNAGKSTLFNALVEEGCALVTDLEGTTRDVLAGSWILRGTRVTLLDTAGTERGRDELEARAQELGEAEARGADLVLHLVEAARSETPEVPGEGPPTLVVRTKLDLGGDARGLGISAATGEGLDELARRVAVLFGLHDEEPAGAPRRLEHELSARHRQALSGCVEALRAAAEALHAGLSLDLVAEELRRATRELDSISGRTTPEDLLDRIFAAFCLGK